MLMQKLKKLFPLVQKKVTLAFAVPSNDKIQEAATKKIRLWRTHFTQFIMRLNFKIYNSLGTRFRNSNILRLNPTKEPISRKSFKFARSISHTEQIIYARSPQ